jgi:hypothetical protein
LRGAVYRAPVNFNSGRCVWVRSLSEGFHRAPRGARARPA